MLIIFNKRQFGDVKRNHVKAMPWHSTYIYFVFGLLIHSILSFYLSFSHVLSVLLILFFTVPWPYESYYLCPFFYINALHFLADNFSHLFSCALSLWTFEFVIIPFKKRQKYYNKLEIITRAYSSTWHTTQWETAEQEKSCQIVVVMNSNEFLYVGFNEVQNGRPDTNEINLSNVPLKFIMCRWKKLKKLWITFECFKDEQIANYMIWPKIIREEKKKKTKAENERWQNSSK